LRGAERTAAVNARFRRNLQEHCRAPGWAGVTATHTGEYLDCAATGRPLKINGLDFWKLQNDRYVENWVFVDMIHLFRQFGVDLFERIPPS